MAERICKSFKVLIGMEIHVQLATQTKLFTSAPNGATNFGAEPNSLVDEVVLGLPGTLPVLNKLAVEYSIKVGLALGCRINRFTKWDRKSYFYPDLPKNYQISQYDLPLCAEGEFKLGDSVIRIRRAHLEEDAGKLLHEAPGGHPIAHSIVDLNRAGTPLLEIVTEPDFSTAKDVVHFAQELQKLVQYLGVSEAQMQRGHMRFEPNINVHITDQDGAIHKTAITEIKNLNSFSVLERATDYEIRRQIDQWESTGSLGKKSTYGWDENSGATFHQRDKEEAQDYRYFPDPDLPPVVINDAWLAELQRSIGESPIQRRRRYVEVLKLPEADAAILAGDRSTGDFFEAALAAGGSTRRTANLMVNVLGTLSNNVGKPIAELNLSPDHVAAVGKLIDSDKVSASSALSILETLSQKPEADPSIVAAELGLLQIDDTQAIDAAIDVLLASNPKSLQDFRAGKQAAMGALVGSIMKQTRGLNPQSVQTRLRERLSND